jgi:hypothetical protein
MIRDRRRMQGIQDEEVNEYGDQEMHGEDEDETE